MILQLATANELNTIIVVTRDIEASLRIADTLWLLGRDRDASGQAIPGASIRYRYDLIERGIAWQPEIENTTEFFALRTEIKQRFASL